jgi:hypothetical protein
LIEAHFGAREVAAFRACAVPAMQADYFRYCAVHALGGVYCDADSHCVGSLKPLLDVEGAVFHGMGKAEALPNLSVEEVLANAIFGFRGSGHPLLRLAIDVATAGIEARASESVGMVTGPGVFTGLAMIRRLGSLDAFFARMERCHRSLQEVFLADREGWLLHLESVRAAIGDYARVVAAFDGVHVSPIDDVTGIATVSVHLEYKRTANHHDNWRGSIYRCPA